jgi:hypothetical protein
MVRRLLLAAVLLAALPLAGGSASAAKCQQWNAANPSSHHKAGPIDVVGGKGYGSGYHDAAHRSPPQPMGAYGDPQRRSAEGGYVEFKRGAIYAQVNAFGPFDETDNAHNYDTVAGACVSSGSTGVSVERCVPTSKVRTPTNWGKWTPCGGY